MGRNHARVYRDLGVELVGVVDPTEVGRQVAELYGAPHYESVEALLATARPQAASVAVPTHAHYQVASELIEAGVHVLVEKPVAATVEQGRRLVAMAAQRQVVLAVGHIERYNTAIVDLKRRLDEGQLGRVFQANARRLGPFPNRIRDVGVVVDLATHDLDIMRYVSGSEATRVYAETRREIHTSNEDLVNALVSFDGGMLGLLEINWLTPTKIREFSVTGERGMFRVDYLTQDLYFFENPVVDASTFDQHLSVLRGGVHEGAMTRYALSKHEPLRREIEAFLAAVRGEQSSIVTGDDGVAALRLALAVIDAANRGSAIEVAGV